MGRRGARWTPDRRAGSPSTARSGHRGHRSPGTRPGAPEGGASPRSEVSATTGSALSWSAAAGARRERQESTASAAGPRPGLVRRGTPSAPPPEGRGRGVSEEGVLGVVEAQLPGRTGHEIGDPDRAGPPAAPTRHPVPRRVEGGEVPGPAPHVAGGSRDLDTTDPPLEPHRVHRRGRSEPPVPAVEPRACPLGGPREQRTQLVGLRRPSRHLPRMAPPPPPRTAGATAHPTGATADPMCEPREC